MKKNDPIIFNLFRHKTYIYIYIETQQPKRKNSNVYESPRSNNESQESFLFD